LGSRLVWSPTDDNQQIVGKIAPSVKSTMNLPDHLFSGPWLWLGNLLFAAVLGVALWRAPWYHLRDNESTHVWLAMCVGILGLWHLKAGILPGLTLHQLGTTLLCLMFGWQFAVISVALILLGLTLNGGAGWGAFGWNGVVMGLVPILVSLRVYRFVDRRLPNNFFIYIFLAAFFGAGAAMGTTGLASVALLSLSGAYPLDRLSELYLPYYLLLLFPEAFLTGMLMSIFVVYRPQWVSSFDDRRYLHGK
jgi:uncharacterized membrane protein